MTWQADPGFYLKAVWQAQSCSNYTEFLPQDHTLIQCNQETSGAEECPISD